MNTTTFDPIDLEPMGFCEFCNKYTELNDERICASCEQYQQFKTIDALETLHNRTVNNEK